MSEFYDLLLASKLSGGGGGGGSFDFCDPAFPSGAIESDRSMEIWSGMFLNRVGITKISMPNATMFNSDSFKGATALEEVHLPLAKMKAYAGSPFEGCTSLKKIVLPSETNGLYSRFAKGCTSLEAFDSITPSLGNSDGFNGCTKLKLLVLRKSSICTLGNINWFTGTPYANGGTGGEAYVPSALLSSYPTASNWSTINGYGTITWKAIEGSYYETHYADGTPIS